MQWNVLCPGCGAVLDSNATLKSVQSTEYHCQLCASGYEPSLDEMVEVTFTVDPRVRRIAAHDPDSMSPADYYQQLFWGTWADLPENVGEALDRIEIDAIEMAAGEKATMSLQLPERFCIVFEPVTHAAQFIDVKGEPTKERRTLSMIFTKLSTQHSTVSRCSLGRCACRSRTRPTGVYCRACGSRMTSCTTSSVNAKRS